MSVENNVFPVATSGPSIKTISIQDWGAIDYEEALRRQDDLVELVRQELARETLVFCTHPPVVTLGRGTREGDVFSWQGPTVAVSRGGRATYHGPNQVVVYPILDLNQRGRDLHKYMRDLETAIVKTLADFGIQAVGSGVALDSDGPSLTGVWVGQRKIASIGIGVRKWITFHGLALNIDRDPLAFQGLNPCGFSAATMLSMEELLGRQLDRADVQATLSRHLLEILGSARPRAVDPSTLTV